MGYFSALIAVCTASCLLTAILPEEGRHSPFLRIVAALTVLSVAISPLFRLREGAERLVGAVRDFAASLQATEPDPQSAAKEYAREIADIIRAEVSREFNIARERVTVSPTVDDSLSLVSVSISVKAADFNPDIAEVSEYVERVFSAPCDTVIQETESDSEIKEEN